MENLYSDPYCKLFHKLSHSCFLDSRNIDPKYQLRDDTQAATSAPAGTSSLPQFSPTLNQMLDTAVSKCKNFEVTPANQWPNLESKLAALVEKQPGSRPKIPDDVIMIDDPVSSGQRMAEDSDSYGDSQSLENVQQVVRRQPNRINQGPNSSVPFKDSGGIKTRAAIAEAKLADEQNQLQNPEELHAEQRPEAAQSPTPVLVSS